MKVEVIGKLEEVDIKAGIKIGMIGELEEILSKNSLKIKFDNIKTNDGVMPMYKWQVKEVK